MMGQRSDLHTLLLSYTSNVYHQPPPGIQMVYPCIIYGKDDVDVIHANNLPYRHKKRYQLTYIDKDPDSVIPDEIGNLPLCVFDRNFTTNNLNHNIFKLYF